MVNLKRAFQFREPNEPNPIDLHLNLSHFLSLRFNFKFLLSVKRPVGHEGMFCFLPRVSPGAEELWGWMGGYARGYSAEDIGIRFNLLCLFDLEGGLAVKAFQMRLRTVPKKVVDKVVYMIIISIDYLARRSLRAICRVSLSAAKAGKT